MKSGLKVLGAQAASPRWHVTVETNPKQTIATVTAFRKDDNAALVPTGTASSAAADASPPPPHEAENERCVKWSFDLFCGACNDVRALCSFGSSRRRPMSDARYLRRAGGT